MSKRVYISTSTEEFKKIGTDGIKFDEFGYGRVYWKEIADDVIIGIEGCDELPYGTLEKSSNELKGMIICTMISFNDQAATFRINGNSRMIILAMLILSSS